MQTLQLTEEQAEFLRWTLMAKRADIARLIEQHTSESDKRYYRTLLDHVERILEQLDAPIKQ